MCVSTDYICCVDSDSSHRYIFHRNHFPVTCIFWYKFLTCSIAPLGFFAFVSVPFSFLVSCCAVKISAHDRHEHINRSTRSTYVTASIMHTHAKGESRFCIFFVYSMVRYTNAPATPNEKKITVEPSHPTCVQKVTLLGTKATASGSMCSSHAAFLCFDKSECCCLSVARRVAAVSSILLGAVGRVGAFIINCANVCMHQHVVQRYRQIIVQTTKKLSCKNC
jgi:hypothetical protein